MFYTCSSLRFIFFVLGIEFTMPLCQNKDSDNVEELFDETSRDVDSSEICENR